MMRPISLLWAMALLPALLNTECGKPQQLAGGTSTSENGKVAGIFFDTSGNPAPHTRVLLIPAGYNPVANSPGVNIAADTSDTLGHYEFDSIALGSYNVEAVQINQRTRSLATGISVTNGTVAVTIDTLRKAGAVKIVLPGDSVNGYIYLPGTDIFARADSGGAFILDSVPAGTVPAIYYAQPGSPAPPQCINTHPVAVPVGDTAKVGFGAWTFSKRLYPNTTGAGANVMTNVLKFPLFVKLTNSNFDFRQAARNGADLRFSKSDNTPLPFQIAQYDSAGGQATIWVKLDTVYGNSSTHYFRMYWGNPAIAYQGPYGEYNSAPVFDTADGFQCVWHMCRNGVAPEVDATQNNYTGDFHGWLSQADTAMGPTGGTQNFDGLTFFDIEYSARGKLDFPAGASYSISAWVFANNLDQFVHPIITKGSNQYGLQLNSANKWEFYGYPTKPGSNSAVAPATAGCWKFLTGVHCGNTQYLFVDGILADSSVSGKSSQPNDSDCNVSVGAGGGSEYEGFGFFNGMLDEVRLSNRAYSPDWILLCFTNQKNPGATVIFK